MEQRESWAFDLFRFQQQVLGNAFCCLKDELQIQIHMIICEGFSGIDNFIVHAFVKFHNTAHSKQRCGKTVNMFAFPSIHFSFVRWHFAFVSYKGKQWNTRQSVNAKYVNLNTQKVFISNF